MQQPQFKQLLRSAVIAAIPLATQTGCVTNEPAPVGNTGPATPVPVNTNDPCRNSGEITRKSAKERYSAQTKLITRPLTAGQCLALCKQEFANNRIGGFNDLIKLERLEASNCKTENLPYTNNPYRGLPSPQPSTLVSCEVDYTALHSPYTCPRPVPGRMPNGLQMDQQNSNHSSIGQYLADMAAMETAAITAFNYLSRELEAYGAPEELIARARIAMEEETRHAEMAGLLSAAYGAETAEVRVDDFVLRSLYEIALENAVEGCVNETFAAACGLWQSKHAELAVFREVIAHITDEEMEHAALSWDIHEWIMPQLSDAQQEQIRLAQVEAADKLMKNFRQDGDPVQQRAFGLPTQDDAARLFARLKDNVWAAVNIGFNEQRLLA